MTTLNTLITYKEYMNGEYSHEKYYGQFVTQGLVNAVKALVGADKIKNSTCSHFNDISYGRRDEWLWDRIDARNYIDTKKWALSGKGVAFDNTYVEAVTGKYGWSPSDNTCMAKAAARVIRRELAEPVKGRQITVKYRPIGDSCGCQSFDTFVNGTVDSILDYYYQDRGILNIGKHGKDFMVRIIDIEFKN